MTVTVITLLKRRPDMSKADFIAYYEEHHRRIGEQVLAGYATRYVRRHLHSMDGTEQPEDADVVTEVDYPDAETRDACFASFTDPEITKLITEDEERLFDRSRIRSFNVQECVSVLGD